MRSQLIEKRSRNAPNQRGSHTDRPHPSHASLVPAELSQWLFDRQSDLLETLELGGSPDPVLQLIVRRGSACDGDERRNGFVTTRSGNWSGAVFGDKCELRSACRTRALSRPDKAVKSTLVDSERALVSTQIDPDDDPPIRSGRFAPRPRRMPSMVEGLQCEFFHLRPRGCG